MKETKKELAWLSKFIDGCEKAKVHWSQSTSWSRTYDEGFNDGLIVIIKELEKRRRVLEKRLKSVTK